MAYTVDELKVFNVHELRAIARDVGVRAPTAKKQKELIELILKIQSREIEPYSSNMGRPVKSGIRSEILKTTNTLSKDMYSQIEVLAKEKCEDCINECEVGANGVVDCNGIIRKIDGRFYIQNYLDECKYVMLMSEHIEKYHLIEGDYIKGKAKISDGTFGDLISIYDKNFNQDGKNNLKEVKVVTVNNNDEMYSYINEDNKINKISLEIESNRNLEQILNECLVIKTQECEDVKVTFNTLMDCKKFIQNLCNQNKDFVLYVNNTEYIYSILTVYYNYMKMDQDLNAGQYFKEILSLISNCEHGSIVLFEKTKGKRSSYLDIIINKYCE